MKIRVPFIRKTMFGQMLKYREVDFVFNIATLEGACERLDLDFWQMSEADPYDFALAVLYEAYLQGCRHKKPKYGFAHAVFWNEHMGRESAEKVKQAMTDLMGKLKKGSEGVKKK
jgi:hypothetical protein